MRFIAPFLALFAAVATAQQNAINVPPGGLQVSANTPVTITWSNPSSGTVTIKLQQGSAVTPDSGITLISGVPAADKTATFTIVASEVNSSQYNFEIIDDSNPNNYNFSPGFDIFGATGTGTASQLAAGTGTAAASASASASAMSTSEASAATTSMSSASNSGTTAMASASGSSSGSAATSSSSSAPSSSPIITNNNGAGSLAVQGGLLAAALAVVAVF